MSNILERLGLTDGVEREITLGKSFFDNAHSEYHTFRYDFKPASVDPTKKSTVDIGEGNQVTVKVPHVDRGPGTTHTVFKGSKKPYRKECVLIIDHKTGEITLEKLSYNVQLKRTRGEGTSKISQSFLENNLTTKKSPIQRRSPLQKSLLSSSSSTGALSKCSPLSKSPNRQSQSSPPSRASPSVPCIAPAAGTSSFPKHSTQSPAAVPSTSKVNVDACEIGILSSSGSSSDSSSSSSSDSESGAEENKINARVSGGLANNPKLTNGSNGRPKPIGNGIPSATANSPMGKSLAVNRNGTTSNSRSGSPILPRFPQKTSGHGFSKVNGNSSPHQVKGNGSLPKVNGNVSPSFKVNGKTSFPKKVLPVPQPSPILNMPKFSQLSEDLRLSESDSD